LPTYLLIAQILVTVALTATILFQLHGGGLGGIFGQSESVYRTRRGMEKTLLRLTITLSVIFVIFAVIIVMSAS
jgi:preprotein translocase subunit SecG